ncbi:unnamed protein product [Prorocentrum cordatum]|uniref:DNA (cytosine-5-)-methyltransferase n=1 Tax=Prorocentrum cordatum TaxID=2364126 RepID=A0ABN9X3F0_9DINO|nr:unnamed protein product [Polarella glacialis]
MGNWVVVATETLRAEFPWFEVVQAWSVFNVVERDRDAGSMGCGKDLLSLLVRFWASGASTSGVEQSFAQIVGCSGPKLCMGMGALEDRMDILDLELIDEDSVINLAMQLWCEHYGCSRTSGARPKRSDTGGTRQKNQGDLPTEFAFSKERRAAATEALSSLPTQDVGAITDTAGAKCMATWTDSHDKEIKFANEKRIKRIAEETWAGRDQSAGANVEIATFYSWDFGPQWRGPANYGYDITYASDCSGLDGGAAALKQMDISFRHAFASEKNSVYRAITAASHPDVEMIYNDMRDRPRDQLQDRHGHIDIYCAGFPCQSFAPNGNKHGTSVEDGALVWEVVRTIDALRPTAFVLENVKALTEGKFRRTFDRIISRLKAIGVNEYFIDWNILDSLDFGVPSKRDRVYIIGIRGASLTSWQWPEPVPRRPLADFLDDKTGDDTAMVNLNFTQLRNLEAGYQKIRDQCGEFTEPFVIDVGSSPRFGTGVSRDHTPTITKSRAGSSEYWIVCRNRLITTNELLRCQGFKPTDVTIPDGVSTKKLQEMIGNAFTVTVFKAIFKAIFKATGRAPNGALRA